MSNRKVITGKVRFSYVHVFTPSVFDDTEKYSVTLLIDKTDTATIDKIKSAVETAKQEGKAKFGGKIPANLKTPLRDGDTEYPEHKEYAGKYFVNANNTRQPGIVDAQRQEIIDPEELYSGCYGRASITFFAFNSNGNKGIACSLNNIQKLADGERLDGRVSAEDDFADDYEDDLI